MIKTEIRATAEEHSGQRGLTYNNLKWCVDTEYRQREGRKSQFLWTAEVAGVGGLEIKEII